MVQLADPANNVTPLSRPGGKPQPDAAPVELTILMPCLNEAETLKVCIEKALGYLERSGVTGEVVVADNGSTDGSQEIARAAGARVVDVPVRGYGAALIGGSTAARGRYIIMGDADDSYDFSSLDAFVGALRGGADLVMGNRFKGGIAPGAMPPLHRYLGNPVLSWLGRLFFKIPVGDFHCGLRGYNRESILALGLKSTGMEYASEMVVKASLANLKIAEVPTTLSPDGRSRAPHLKTWRDGWRHLRFLLLHSPKWLFAVPGLALIGLSLMLGLLTVFGPTQITPDVRIDYHTLVASCFMLIIGVQLVLFSMISRAYAAAEGFLPAPQRMRKTLLSLNLEGMLLFALALFVIGAAGTGWSLSYWASRDFGDIAQPDMLRKFVPSLTIVTCAIQIAAGAFLASVFRIRK
ncbi:glycosyltransferase family 2 protein [Hyphomonas sp.]|uniref:glycosyltransferase family 2 protein n=1 Tax=Hyphomonas sp. TaxID=87 RepID=UPI00391B3C36